MTDKQTGPMHIQPLPNLCRRPLHSFGSQTGARTITSSSPIGDNASIFKQDYKWQEENIYGDKAENGKAKPIGLTSQLQRLKFQDIALDSDSDGDDGQYCKTSTKSVSLFNRIIKSVANTLKKVRMEDFNNMYKPKTRSELSKNSSEMSWYQYLNHFAKSLICTNSGGLTMHRSRKWSLGLLLLPILLLAGFSILPLGDSLRPDGKETLHLLHQTPNYHSPTSWTYPVWDWLSTPFAWLTDKLIVVPLYHNLLGTLSSILQWVTTSLYCLTSGVFTMFFSSLSALFTWPLTCINCAMPTVTSDSQVKTTNDDPPLPKETPKLLDSSLIFSKSEQLVHNLLNSKEFKKVMADEQVMRQEELQSAVSSAFVSALEKMDKKFGQIKKEIQEVAKKQESTDTSVESKIMALKKEIQNLEKSIDAQKTAVINQVDGKSELKATLEKVQKKEQLKMKEILMSEINKVREEIRMEFMKYINEKSITPSNKTPVYISWDLEDLINSTVQRLIDVYDADKTAKADYALANTGANVLSVRCTETFTKKDPQYFLWGYPIWSKTTNYPRIALEPSVLPGECWAFAGSRGNLVIQLSKNITVTAVTLEHLPRSLSPSGNIYTAPKDFKVLGLETEDDESPTLLGWFKYEDNGRSLQQFQTLVVDRGFKIVELVVESNHGHPVYTCLYRFRVHGHPVRH